MTRDEVRNALAGPELDRLVSEHVMRIAPRDVRIRGETNTVRVWSDNLALSDGVWDAERLRIYGQPPRYSEDPGDAWLVVDRLGARGVRLVLEDWRHEYGPGVISGWAALFTMPDCHDTGQVIAPSMPLAVCRAALLACSERQQQERP